MTECPHIIRVCIPVTAPPGSDRSGIVASLRCTECGAELAVVREEEQTG